MRQRMVSLLLRVLGGCFLLYGLSVIVLALTCQTQAVGSVQYSGAMIFWDPIDVGNFIFYGGMFPGNAIVPFSRGLNMIGPLTPGPLMWVGLGTLCISLTMKLAVRRVPASYVGLQVALWMISASVWTPILWLRGSTQYGLGAVQPLFLVTLVLSLILLAIYRPVSHGLSNRYIPGV